MKSLRRSRAVKLVIPLLLLVSVCSGAGFLMTNMLLSDGIMIGDGVAHAQSAMVNGDDAYWHEAAVKFESSASRFRL